MIVKQLIQNGNSKALVIDKALLQAASLPENASFLITVKPNGGLLIESVEPTNKSLMDEAFKKVKKKHYNLFKRLSDR